MESKVKLGSKTLVLHSSVYSIIKYKSLFGTELFTDVKKLEFVNSNKAEDNISEVLDLILKITYVLYRNHKFDCYEDFISSLELDILSDTKGLEELSSTIAKMLGSVKPKTPSK
jgi:hypothetical protein